MNWNWKKKLWDHRHHAMLIVILPGIFSLVVHFRFKWIEIVKTSCEITNTTPCWLWSHSVFFCQLSILRSNELKFKKKLWDHRHFAMLIVILPEIFSSVVYFRFKWIEIVKTICKITDTTLCWLWSYSGFFHPALF